MRLEREQDPEWLTPECQVNLAAESFKLARNAAEEAKQLMQSTPKFTAAAEPKPEAAAELSGAQLQQATNDWFTSKPAVGASIVEIGSWFRGQPANATFRFTGEDHLPILQWLWIKMTPQLTLWQQQQLSL